MSHVIGNDGLSTNRRHPDSAGASKMATDASLRRLVPLAWPLFAVLWLVFPIASVVDMLGTGLTPVRLLEFLASMVAYVSVYLWLVLRYPFRGELRLRFARDLHDLLGHSLSSITLKSELAGRLLPVAPEVRDIEGVARNALREVREAVAGYRQPTLDEELASAQQILETAGIACQIERSVGVLPNDEDAVLAWTVREGTTNVIRHSHAKHCEIRLMQESEEIHAEISDDRVGSSPPSDETNVNGSGLSGLAERVAASSGKFEAKTPSGGGFSLRVSLPL